MSNSPCRKAILEAGVLELGAFELENGTRANNKLIIDNLFNIENKLRLQIVMRHLAKVAMKFKPDVIIGVPTEGEKLVKGLSEQQDTCHVPVANLRKTLDTAGNKLYEYKTIEDQELVSESQSLVIVKDVFDKFTSIKDVLSVSGISERTSAVIAVWDRGNHPSRPRLSVPSEALVTEYIPNNLHVYNEIYGYGIKIDRP